MNYLITLNFYINILYFVFVFKNGRTPKSDGVKTNDIPNDLLTVLPKAPRIASEFPASWDWNIFYEPVDKSVSKLKSKNMLTQVSIYIHKVYRQIPFFMSVLNVLILFRNLKYKLIQLLVEQ